MTFFSNNNLEKYNEKRGLILVDVGCLQQAWNIYMTAKENLETLNVKVSHK